MGFANELTLASIDLFPLGAAGGVSPSMALGTMATRPALLVKITDTQGCFGWGEVWANFPPRATHHKAHLIEDVVAPVLTGWRYTDPSELEPYLQAKLGIYFLHIGQPWILNHIAAGLDTALWDLALRSAGVSFAQHMNLANSRAKTYASSINEPDLEQLLPKHADLGQQHFKLKLGFETERDRAYVARAHAIKPADTQILIDTNQKWTLDQARAALDDLSDYDVGFSEEPLRADAPRSEWEALAKASPIPLAGGENINSLDEFLALADAGLEFLQPDVAKWGGISGALELAKRVPKGVKIWPHFMGTAVGQQAALAVTSALGPSSVCEMDVNVNPLRTDLCGNAADLFTGTQKVGLITPPNAELLRRFSASDASYTSLPYNSPSKRALSWSARIFEKYRLW